MNKNGWKEKFRGNWGKKRVITSYSIHYTKLYEILGYNPVFGQKADSLNVYFQALKLHLDYWDNFQKKRPDLVQIPDVYFIEQNDFTTDSLPNTINGHKIEVHTRKEIYEKTKKEGIPLIFIKPARWDNGRLVIHVRNNFV